MQLDAILEVAIGLVMMWLVLSVATMEIQNWLGQVSNVRAKYLEQALLEMFKGEQGLVDQFYNHPAIKELFQKDRKGNLKKPTWIPNETFSRVAMELLVNASKQKASTEPGAVSFSAMADGVQQIKSMNPELEELMDHLFPGLNQTDAVSFGIEDVQGKLKQYQANVETWFDHNMGKVSTWYKENAQTMAFIIGTILAIAFNVDTINITEKLWREPTVRQALVAQADTYQLEEGTANISEVPGYFDSLAMPVGWTSIPAADVTACRGLVTITSDNNLAYWAGNECKVLVNVPAMNDIGGWIIKLLGFVLSAFAARQGAPFWFDMLRRLVSLRESAKQEKKEEAKG
jgi:hypothetical protein